jgi:hypothetical protein
LSRDCSGLSRLLHLLRTRSPGTSGAFLYSRRQLLAKAAIAASRVGSYLEWQRHRLPSAGSGSLPRRLAGRHHALAGEWPDLRALHRGHEEAMTLDSHQLRRQVPDAHHAALASRAPRSVRPRSLRSRSAAVGLRRHQLDDGRARSALVRIGVAQSAVQSLRGGNVDPPPGRAGPERRRCAWGKGLRQRQSRPISLGSPAGFRPPAKVVM